MEKKVEKWTLKFWKPYFLMFFRFFTKLCCKWFFEKFCGMFDPILGFLLSKNDFAPLNLKWNPRKFGTKCCFKAIFCLLFWNGFLEHVAIFLALVALKCICCVCRYENVSLAVVALKIFLVLFSLKIVFWRLSLRKWFFALVALKMIICSCCCENYFFLQSL